MKRKPKAVNFHPAANRMVFFNVLFIVFFITGCIHRSAVKLLPSPAAEFKAGNIAEFNFEVKGNIENPYNNEEISIDFLVWQENGDTLVVPAFYYVPYLSDGNLFSQNGKPYWKVRFTPKTGGRYSYYLSVGNGTEREVTKIKTFVVKENSFQGFITTNPDDRLFRHSSGEVFFPSGINLAHPPHNGESLDYGYFFRRMKENDMNFMRIWLTPQWGKHAIALEWTDEQYPSQKGKLGLRKINSEMAYRLDSIMKRALENGIYVMLCLLDERELEPGSHWTENPYNEATGGVISDPMDFFSDEHAKSAFRNRLRYLIARYSAYPNLFAWEFWNEFDHHRLIPDWESHREDVGRWHYEMSSFLKLNDPHGHMVSTSVVGARTDKIIWDYDEMDFVQAHSYVGKEHLADRSYELLSLFKEEYPGKPFFIGEMGTDWRGFNKENNAESVGLHNGLWETSLGGHSATGMWWWWYEIDEANLWNEWKNIAVFTKGLDRNKSKYCTINLDDYPAISGRYVFSGDSVWAWFYNREFNWNNVRENKKITTTIPVRVRLEYVPEKSYRILRFREGKFVDEGVKTESGRAVYISLPGFETDYAVLLVAEK